MKIQFVSETPLEIEHYAPVVAELIHQNHKSDIVPWHATHDDPGMQQSHDADFQKSLALLEDRQIPFTLDKDRSADIAVVTSRAVELKGYDRAVKLKFRYGMPTIRQNVHYTRDALEGFDGMLVHGEMDKEIFGQYFDPAWIEPIGFPLYDSFFRSPPDAGELREKLAISTDRPVIAYLPTWNWNGHSSILPFRTALAALARQFCVVIKPHPCTELWTEEREAYAALKAISPEFLLPSTAPLADAMAVADLLITDAKSGTTSEAPLAYPEKPVIMLTPFDGNAFWPAIRAIGPLINDPEQLAVAVDDALREDNFEVSRRDFAVRAFGSRRGDASAQAVDSIMRLYQKNRDLSLLGRLSRRIRGLARV
ncbi:MAG: CDP-glycerol glycerophosphotransferase family protein [Gammaproteobacteria bacterium]|nr:CDP-glycerol glycerophosphotransferase family protein [Gammaproteobacteria bacterium]